jgi:predicted ATPase
VKELAQLGATLGREFSYDLLHAVSPLDESSLQQGLRQLVEVELLYQRGLPPQATYLFKHVLIQDTAYQSLLKSTRQHYHQQIAQVLEARFSDIKDTQPELLAHHYTEAGLIEQAILYWQRAGKRASQRSAYVEAVAHLTKGLELLKALPDTPERVQQELTLQITLSGPLMWTKGFGSPEVEQLYTRARELCRQVGETPQLVPVLLGLVLFHANLGKLQTALELSEQFLSLAQRIHNPAHLLWSHCLLGMALLYLGEFVPSREHLEQGIASYDLQQYCSLAPSGTIDPVVSCLSYAALVLWLLGYPDQALKRNHEALTLAQRLAHPDSLGLALWCAAWLHQFRREGQAAQECAEALITLSTEQGFAQWSVDGTTMQGWALTEQGKGEEGIAQMHQSLAALQAMRVGCERTYWLALLAEAHGKVGEAEQGLAVLVEALAQVEKTGERFYEAELYRLKGTLTLQSKIQGSHSAVAAEAEECFLQAIAIARKQQGKSLELRAVMSLSRLWQRQGKKDEARHLLSEIYGWFTEGFDTKDLQEAKTLLEELS